MLRRWRRLLRGRQMRRSMFRNGMTGCFRTRLLLLRRRSRLLALMRRVHGLLLRRRTLSLLLASLMLQRLLRTERRASLLLGRRGWLRWSNRLLDAALNVLEAVGAQVVNVAGFPVTSVALATAR